MTESVFGLIRGRKNKGEHRSPFPLLDTMALSPIRRIIAFSPYISTDFNTFHQNKMYIDKYKKWCTMGRTLRLHPIISLRRKPT